MSKWAAVSVDVPQGSILGTLLFVFYVNDAPSAVSHHLLDLYAHDAELHSKDSDLQMVENSLQSDLTSVTTWLGRSHICLDVDKTNCMLIDSHQKGVISDPFCFCWWKCVVSSAFCSVS